MPEILRYRGDVRNVDWDHMLGPDVGHRYMTIKSVAYDADADISTATLRPILPDEFRERVLPLVEGQRERERIRRVFNA